MIRGGNGLKVANSPRSAKEVCMADEEHFLERLLEQERTLVFKQFDFGTARDLGMLLLRRATEANLPLSLDITRVHQQLFHVALPGTCVDNDHWISRKVAVVYRFGHSSLYVGASCRAKGVEFASRYLVEPTAYAPYGGAFPINVEGVGLVGTIAVSGLPQEDDHRFVVMALSEFLDVDSVAVAT
jgi:uncharacterized protein (UPF0303 family)